MIDYSLVIIDEELTLLLHSSLHKFLSKIFQFFCQKLLFTRVLESEGQGKDCSVKLIVSSTQLSITATDYLNVRIVCSNSQLHSVLQFSCLYFTARGVLPSNSLLLYLSIRKCKGCGACCFLRFNLKFTFKFEMIVRMKISDFMEKRFLFPSRS